MPIVEAGPTKGKLREFDAGEIALMNIRTQGVRSSNSGADHPTETREMNQSTMRRTFFVAWDQRFNFCELVCGRAVQWYDAGTAKISRLLPHHKWGRHPHANQIVATKVEEIRGFGRCTAVDVNGMPTYPDALVKVLYEHVPYEIRSDGAGPETDRYIMPGDSSGTVEAITMPGAALNYVTANGASPHGKPIPFNISVTRTAETKVYSWRMVPYDTLTPGSVLHTRLYEGDDEDGIPYIGCINKLPLEAAFGGYPPGTALLERVELHLLRSHLADGWYWDVDFHFSIIARGWNALPFFNPSAPTENKWYYINRAVYQAPGSVQDSVVPIMA